MDTITQRSHRPSLPSLFMDPIVEESKAPSDVAPASPPEDDELPLRVFVFDTQRTSSQLFSRQLLSHLRFGSIANPYALAATFGPERVQPKLQNNDQVRQAWENQLASAPPKYTSLTYHAATEKLLREADRLEGQGRTLFVREHAPLVLKPEVILSAIHSDDTKPIPQSINPTCLPDELLQIITPIIFIRHPARVIPAWLREANSNSSRTGTPPLYTVDDDDCTLWTSARWSRMLFDYIRSTNASQKRPVSRRKRERADSVLSNTQQQQQEPLDLPFVATRPIVIDAADVVHNTPAILATLCNMLDLPTAAESENAPWTAATTTTEKFQRAYTYLTKTMSENLMKAFSERVRDVRRPSSALHRNTHGSSARVGAGEGEEDEYNISLPAEHRAWTREFGPTVAAALRRKVEADMPHYLYLRTFKLRVRDGPPAPAQPGVMLADGGNGRRVSASDRLAPASTIEGSGPGTMESIWSESEREAWSGMEKIVRSVSLGQAPVGIFG